MLIKPIPRNLLIHSATLNHITGTDSFNKKTYGTGIALTFVRVEPIKKIVVGTGELTNANTDKLFYDCTNSRPKGVIFEKEDKFIFNGKILTVREIETLYALDGITPHHYEIRCS